MLTFCKACPPPAPGTQSTSTMGRPLPFGGLQPLSGIPESNTNMLNAYAHSQIFDYLCKNALGIVPKALYISSFLTLTTAYKAGFIIIPILQKRKWKIRLVVNLSPVLQLIIGRARVWTLTVWFQSLCLWPNNVMPPTLSTQDMAHSRCPIYVWWISMGWVIYFLGICLSKEIFPSKLQLSL